MVWNFITMYSFSVLYSFYRPIAAVKLLKERMRSNEMTKVIWRKQNEKHGSIIEIFFSGFHPLLVSHFRTRAPRNGRNDTPPTTGK